MSVRPASPVQNRWFIFAHETFVIKRQTTLSIRAVHPKLLSAQICSRYTFLRIFFNTESDARIAYGRTKYVRNPYVGTLCIRAHVLIVLYGGSSQRAGTRFSNLQFTLDHAQKNTRHRIGSLLWTKKKKKKMNALKRAREKRSVRVHSTIPALLVFIYVAGRHFVPLGNNNNNSTHCYTVTTYGAARTRKRVWKDDEH